MKLKELKTLLTFTPRSDAELAFRTRMRVGAVGVCALLLFLAVKIIMAAWPVLLVLGIISAIVWAVVKRRT